jgi:FixJ family two-component response regulator
MATGTVVLLDDDQDMRDALGQLIGLLSGGRCLGLASVAELMARRDDVLAARLVILDINLGPRQPSGLDGYDWLQRERFAGRIVFLTGHAHSHPLVARAAALGNARVYAKPIEERVLCELLGVPFKGEP